MTKASDTASRKSKPVESLVVNLIGAMDANTGVSAVKDSQPAPVSGDKSLTTSPEEAESSSSREKQLTNQTVTVRLSLQAVGNPPKQVPRAKIHISSLPKTQHADARISSPVTANNQGDMVCIKSLLLGLTQTVGQLAPFVMKLKTE